MSIQRNLEGGENERHSKRGEELIGGQEIGKIKNKKRGEKKLTSQCENRITGLSPDHRTKGRNLIGSP